MRDVSGTQLPALGLSMAMSIPRGQQDGTTYATRASSRGRPSTSRRRVLTHEAVAAVQPHTVAEHLDPSRDLRNAKCRHHGVKVRQRTPCSHDCAVGTDDRRVGVAPPGEPVPEFGTSRCEDDEGSSSLDLSALTGSGIDRCDHKEASLCDFVYSRSGIADFSVGA